MRSIQRIRHQRPPGPRQRTQIRYTERRAVSRKKGAAWARRLRRFLVLAAVAGAVSATIWLGRGARIVTDGVVRADLVVARSPAPVRVREVFVSQGQRCRRGEPLLALEPLDPSALNAERLAVEEMRLRLRLAESGGEVGVTQLGSRGDLAARAELEVADAAGGLEVARSRLDALLAERDAVALAVRESAMKTSAEVSAREAEFETAELGLQDVLGSERLSRLDVDNLEALKQEGITSQRDSFVAGLEHEQAVLDVAQVRAQNESLLLALVSARRIDELGRLRGMAQIEEVEARIETARHELKRSEQSVERWREVAALRRDLLPEGDSRAHELRHLELALLQAQLSTAEARLAARALELGATTIVAECDAVVDRIDVRPGAVVDGGAPLIHYYDPATLRVVAYAPARDIGRIAAGAECGLVLSGRSEVVTARVGTIGASLVPSPPELRVDAKEVEYRLPVSVDGIDWEETFLRPHMRLKVILPVTKGL